VQFAIFVGGLWGIFYYKEIRGLKVLWWFMFVVLALGGIIGLSLMQFYGAAEHSNSTRVDL
jgi:hypothetical protein